MEDKMKVIRAVSSSLQHIQLYFQALPPFSAAVYIANNKKKPQGEEYYHI